MVRGLPDDANVKVYGDMQRSDDVTELAARLGSPLTYERRGNVLHAETFALGAANWTVTREGTPETPTLTGEHHVTGGASLYLANVAGEAETVIAQRTLPLFSQAQYGVYIVGSMGADTNRFDLDLLHYDGARLWQYMLRLSVEAETAGILGSDGNPVELDDAVNFFTGEGHFHVLSMLLNTATNRWIEARIDGTTYPLPDAVAQSWTNTTAPRLVVALTVVATVSVDAVAVIDSVILAQNPTALN